MAKFDWQQASRKLKAVFQLDLKVMCVSVCVCVSGLVWVTCVWHIKARNDIHGHQAKADSTRAEFWLTSCCTLKDLCTSFTSVFPSNFFLPVLLVLVYCSLESNQISHTEAESLLANQKVSGLSSIWTVQLSGENLMCKTCHKTSDNDWQILGWEYLRAVK